MTAAVPISAGIGIAELLRNAPFDTLDNRLLVAHALRLSRTALITQSEHQLDADEAARVTAAFTRRAAGEPIAYILGSREFYGLALRVTPDVLIPRADTELLVDLVLARAAPGAAVADLGTGSGAIAVAVARNRPDVQVTATDASAAALEVAAHNAALHLVRLTLLQGDWLVPLAQRRFDIIASNPPYIRAGDSHLGQGDLPFEPVDALTDHADGLTALRILAAGAPRHLQPGGWLLLEHGHDQAAAVRALLSDAGMNEVASWTDLAGIERVSGGRMA
jgi:release factor glutamine methyltransferase